MYHSKIYLVKLPLLTLLPPPSICSHPYLLLGFSCSSAVKESACNAGDPGSVPESGRSPGEGIGYPLQCSWASLVAQLIKNPPEMWETCSIPELGRFPGEGNGYPLQYSGLENSMDCIIHAVAKSRTQLNDFHFHFTSC